MSFAEEQIPEETKIFYSKLHAFFGIVGAALLTVAGLFVATCSVNLTIGIALFFLGILIAFLCYKTYKNNAPQIIISDRGLETASTGFYAWEEIGNERAATIGEGKSKRFVLVFDSPKGQEEFSLSGLDEEVDRLPKLLLVYRKRSGVRYKYADNNFLKGRIKGF